MRQQCYLCFNEFRSLKDLEIHFRASHRGVQFQRLQCPRCEERFTYREQLMRHSRTHAEKRRLESGMPCGVHIL